MSEEHTEHTHHPNYVRIWAILAVLLAISVLGPMLEIRMVTLITAFGIAVVKAYLVAKNFMHINIAPRFVGYLVGTCLVFMVLLFAGVSPDVMKPKGENWVKPGWTEVHIVQDLEQGLPGHEAGHEGH
jgi:caa(3)-type oxidase subunit IV